MWPVLQGPTPGLLLLNSLWGLLLSLQLPPLLLLPTPVPTPWLTEVLLMLLLLTLLLLPLLLLLLLHVMLHPLRLLPPLLSLLLQWCQALLRPQSFLRVPSLLA